MSITFQNAQSNTGTCTVTATAAPSTTWSCTSLSVSLAGPTQGANGKVTIWDGAVGTGTVIHAEYLPGPGTGSVGTTIEVKIPKDQHGRPGLQALTGNAMNIQVTGTGANQVSINARFCDGLP